MTPTFIDRPFAFHPSNQAFKGRASPLQGDTREACRSIRCMCATDALENHLFSNNAQLGSTFLLAQLQP